MADPASLTDPSLKRTALYSVQKALRARFGTFGGWELPLYFSTILQEHEAVRSRVGLFDVSHLGHLELTAAGGAVAALSPLVTQDLARLKAGRALYTPMLDDSGVILDEMILYCFTPERLRLVVNAANGDKILSWLRSHLVEGAQVEDLRGQVGTLALQGPRALELIRKVAPGAFDGLARHDVGQGQVMGVEVWAARTGYTGEDGLELFVETRQLVTVWNGLLEAGRPLGIASIGLGARDTLRLEAGLPLGGSDLDATTTPLEAGLEWTVSWDKGAFVGREALERQRKAGVKRRLAGFALKGPGIPRHGYPILREGRPIGQVTSGTVLPSKQGIGMGYVEPDCAHPGTNIAIEIHGRAVAAEIVKLPFYRRRQTSSS